MARDIEEFLRRAAERRKQQQQASQQSASQQRASQQSDAHQSESQQQASQQSAQQSAKRRETGGRKPPPQQRKKPQSRPPLVEQVEVVGRQQRRKKGLREQSVKEHVASHIDSSQISRHAEGLGNKIQEVEERGESRLRQSFDHSVGGLGGRETITDDRLAESMGDDVSHLAVTLFQMLTTRHGIRNAIVAAEILRRPDFDD